MTRDPGVKEHAFNSGVRVLGGQDIELRDLHVHHWATDGVYLGPIQNDGCFHPIRDVRLISVLSEFSARGALGITGVWGATFSDCTFARTARSDGSYGGQAPQFGIDIEPLGSHEIPAAQKTGNLSFVRCRVLDCFGAVLTAPYWARYDGKISFSDCEFDGRGSGPEHPIAVRFQAPDGLMADCTIRSYDRTTFLTVGIGGETSVVYRQVTFSVTGTGELVSRRPSNVLLDRCEMIIDRDERSNKPALIMTNSMAAIQSCRFSVRGLVTEKSRTLVRLAIREAGANRFEGETVDSGGRPCLTDYRGTQYVHDETYPTQAWRSER
jgi:hypothetical protein